MRYATSYLNASRLAERIRQGASEGKSVKATGGLAAREERRSEPFAGMDLEQIRARYMNLAQDIFKRDEEEAPSVKEEEVSLSYGLGSPMEDTSSAEYSLGRELTGDDFLSRLIMSESSGNPQAVYTTADGRSFVGLAQIGDARLSDYNKATGSSVEQADLLQNVDIQNEVIRWHINDLTSLATKLAKDSGLSVQGLVAVGHLGGRGGMTKFAQSGGKHNPSDELGTSLMDYYQRFKS